MNTRSIQTEGIPSIVLPEVTDTLLKSFESQRKSFEKKWYDNNFFDDGYHFRYISRTTGKIVDLNDKSNSLPTRAIPKASRQIRGVANLLLQPDYVPVIYPEKVESTIFPTQQDPMTGQMMPNPAYKQALDAAKLTAKRSGHWITEEWKNQHLIEKLMHMVLLTSKHGISYMQIWPDAVEEKIKTAVFDAFDIYLMGNVTSIYESPAIIKTSPQLIAQIKANENFEPVQLEKLIPDNKYANSELKQAYMEARLGTGTESDHAATLIVKEVFLKEYLSDKNVEDVKIKGQKYDVLAGKKTGDMVMRHAFVAGGIWLLDEYIDLPDYPFVDFRMEPGPIYQVPLIERFIPANKSLDIIASRVERYINTMTAGSWLVRKGEDVQITNLPGGQKIEYSSTLPQQAQLSPIPSHVFNMMDFLSSNIEEQGASTSALGQVPNGVKSGVAIESLKATEYANLKIASNQLKETVRGICEKMLDIADKYFLSPQTVFMLEEGEPKYFDIIGQKGMDIRENINKQIPGSMPMPDATPIKGEYRVDINIESGLGFTMEGKKESMQQIITYFTGLMQQGLITQEAVQVLTKQFMDIYGFGATQDLMDALENGTTTAPMNEEQLMQIKIAVAEAMKDAGVAGRDAEETQINTTKVGVAEALKDLQTK